MSENKTPETGTATPNLPGVAVKIYLPKDPDKDHGKLLGFASVNLGGVFAVNNIRIYDSEKGPFVTMPGRKGHPGVLSIFVTQTRKEMDAMQKQTEKKPSIKAQLSVKPVPGDQPAAKPKDREVR